MIRYPAFATSLFLASISPAAEPINIGSRLEPLFDDFLIESIAGKLELEMHHAMRQQEAIT